MKKVILENKTSQIYLSDLDEYHIIGIMWESGRKSFIQRSEEKGFYSIGRIEKNHSFECKVFYPSVSKYCEQPQIKSVFVFENEKELFKWMAE